MTKILYSIKYTNRLTGKRSSYMNIGFETPESAQIELDKLLRESTKTQYSIEELMKIQPQYLHTYMVGCDWKIETVKCRTL